MKKLLLVVLTALLALSFTGCAPLDYSKATKLLESGDYTAARPLFEAIQDYKDSADKLKECDYLKAAALSSEKKYEEAGALFASLGDYKDSAELDKENRYLLAGEQTAAGNYEEALKLYRALEDYKQSKTLAASAEDECIKKALVGSWLSADVDGTDAFISSLTESMGDENLVKEFDDFKFLFKYALQLTNQGTLEFYVDEEKFGKSLQDMKDCMIKAMLQSLETELQAVIQETGLTMQDLLDYYEVKDLSELFELINGIGLEEFVDILLEDMKDLPEDKAVGTYTVNNGEVSINLGTDAMKGSFDLEKDELTISQGIEGDMATIPDQFPLIFDRQKED